MLTKCPNCGGYKVNEERYKMPPSHSLPLYDLVESIPMAIIFGISAVLLIVGFALGLTIGSGDISHCGDNPGAVLTHCPAPGISIGIATGGMLLLFIWLALLLIIKPVVSWLDDLHGSWAATWDGYKYTCDICGYKWIKRFGDPEPSGPTSGVNPQLIELGEESNKRRKSDAIFGEYVRQQQAKNRQKNQ